ncbi:alpha/beta hydrolase-fold protein [uncultured Mucilaginibacter sp.]|uniref:esterase family protein n=1 Tax=uncultured Mucilaginibacter sp. TaxID=797541 RepID=UPI0025DDF35D|nr:alpha/beta hydrolase-fold protein [uncultured Mucilaginibacter sp.]
MQREYHKWFSERLQKNMELLVFGHAGARVIFFPTRGARFYDYENWRVIEAISDKIENGWLQVYCVDSVDHESFYNFSVHPIEKLNRHLQYEQYILNEVITLSQKNNPDSPLFSAGCSLGAYHAVNIAFKYPYLFNKTVGMSGRYDLTKPMGVFVDLLEGYYDQDIYFNMPNHYLSNMGDEYLLNKLKQMEIILAIGQEDAFLDDTTHLSEVLWKMNVPNALHIWEGEAHKPRYWRKMVQLYL